LAAQSVVARATGLEGQLAKEGAEQKAPSSK